VHPAQFATIVRRGDLLPGEPPPPSGEPVQMALGQVEVESRA
jgi:hypothetical protein